MSRRIPALSIILIAACAHSAFSAQTTGIKAGDVAPSLDGKTWIAKDGKAPDLSNKIYVVAFWLAADGASGVAAPKLSQMATKYADKGLVVVAPGLDGEAKVREFKKKHNIGDEISFLADGRPAAKAFGVLDYPTAYLVGKDGKVLYVGHPSNQDFQKAVEKALQ